MGAIDIGDLPPEVGIRNYFKPGDVGYLTCLHGTLYGQEYGWDHTFEAYVAGPLAEFAKSHNDRERVWIVETGGKVAGSIAIVEACKEDAQLRWLLLHPNLRGHGIGRFLVEGAIRFSRESRYSAVFLWTVSALQKAAKLYLSAGFKLTQENRREMWGQVVTEQRYYLKL